MMRTPSRAWLLCTLVAAGCGSSGLGGTGLPDLLAPDAAPGDGPLDDGALGDFGPGDLAPGSDGGCGPQPAPAPGLAITERGAIRGTMEGATWSWKGIPYAAPPTGLLRFRPPTDHACFAATLDASQFGNQCPQLDANGAHLGNEDCLTLNVWAPAAASPKPLPVMVFIHGGANIQGASSEQNSGVYLYDAQHVVEAAPVVVVTINYRLGALGFFALPLLDNESEHKASGNYGVLDQIAALAWVKRNGAAFGGDPSRVMIFGESAGAVDVCMLMVSPLAAGLFSGALMESGGCPATTLLEAETQDTALLGAAGCDKAPDVLGCLRGLSAEAITKAIPGVGTVTGLDKGTKYGPVVDGWVLTAAPMTTLKSGAHNHVPFVIGSNSDETSKATPVVPSAAAYDAIVIGALGARLGAQALAQYPAASYPTPRAALVALTTDARFVCPSRQVARAVAGGQREPVRRYFYTHALDSGPARVFGAWHGAELLAVFGHLNLAGYVPSVAESALSASMIGYWTRFAAAGDPNGGGAVNWPVYSVQSDPYLQLDDTISAGTGVRTAKCDFWDTLL